MLYNSMKMKSITCNRKNNNCFHRYQICKLRMIDLTKVLWTDAEIIVGDIYDPILNYNSYLFELHKIIFDYMTYKPVKI